MKVKIPRQIEFGIYRFRILLNPHLRNDKACDGFVNFRTQIIEIEGTLNDAERMSTLCHEVNHISERTKSFSVTEEVNGALCMGQAEFFCQLGIEFDWGNIEQID